MQLNPELRSGPDLNENADEISTRIANRIYHGIWRELDQSVTLRSIYSTTIPSQFADRRVSEFPEFPQFPEFPGVIRGAPLTEMDWGGIGAGAG